MPAEEEAERDAGTGEYDVHANLVSEYVVARAALIKSLVSHRTLTGAGRETAISELLNSLLPRRYEALSGTVINRSPKSAKPQIQIDVMVANTFDFPVPIRQGAVSCILPQALVAAIEVKSDLSKSEFIKGMVQVCRARQTIDSGTHSSLLSFGGPSNASELHDWISALNAVIKVADPIPKESDPKQVSVQNHDISRAAFDAAKEVSWSRYRLPQLIVGMKGGVAILQPARASSSPTYDLYTSADGALSAVIHEVFEALQEHEKGKQTLSHTNEMVSIYGSGNGDGYGDELGGRESVGAGDGLGGNSRAVNNSEGARAWYSRRHFDAWETMRNLYRLPSEVERTLAIEIGGRR
jgi:hypothetical protein